MKNGSVVSTMNSDNKADIRDSQRNIPNADISGIFLNLNDVKTTSCNVVNVNKLAADYFTKDNVNMDISKSTFSLFSVYCKSTRQVLNLLTIVINFKSI